jgi:predicted O-methyltransferase YrrM
MRKLIIIKKYLPNSLIGVLRLLRNKYSSCVRFIAASLIYPLNVMKFFMINKQFFAESIDETKRSFNYKYELLPNSFLIKQEKGVANIDSAIRNTGLTVGYPAWNLLYYSLLCSLSDISREVVVVETGTNQGYSTIVLAQALNDINAKGYVHTVDISKSNIELAKYNVEKAGLIKYVKFYEDDAVAFLKDFVKKVKYVDFIFIDDLHEYSHIKKEFSIIYPRIVACNGKAHFDNTSQGGVCNALHFIKNAYPGNIIEFRNCSWSPPGNAIWQSD